MQRLTIGELAQASGLSPASIRRYGVAGVLPPAWVDEQTGELVIEAATGAAAGTLRRQRFAPVHSQSG